MWLPISRSDHSEEIPLARIPGFEIARKLSTLSILWAGENGHLTRQR
jgi:hypothetical protein